jgi:LacI family transcriptional regulator, repressor for deo operon, udp, cdd, tsx, nupC, and nupG
MPVIAVGGPTLGMPRIGVDDRGVIRAALDHVISLGHRRIGLVGGVDAEGLNDRVPEDRQDAFVGALEEAGLAVREDWMLEGGYRMGIAKAAVGDLLADGGDDLPTALVCASDEMAIGAICALQDAGMRVPGDVSVVGIDGHEYGECFGLTTVRQFPELQGRDAASWVVAEIASGRPGGPPAVARYELIVRTSTAPPPA